MKVNKTLLLFLVLIGVCVVVVFLERPLFLRKSSKPLLLFPDFRPDSSRRIEIKDKSGKVVLERKEGRWKVASCNLYPADKEKVDRALNLIKELRKGKVVSRNPKKRSLYQVDEEEGGVSVKVLAGEDPGSHFFIGKIGPDYMSNYVRRADSEEVILSHKPLKHEFSTNNNDWREKAIFRFRTNEVCKVVIEKEKERIVLVKKGEEWVIDEPLEGGSAKKSEVESLLGTLSCLDCSGFEDEKDLAECGLSAPKGKITCLLSTKEEKVLLIGDDTNGKTYVKKEDGPQIFTLPRYRVKRLLRSLSDLKKEEEIGEK